MAGELIAAAITEHDDRWRLFLPYELVWAGGRLGRLVQQVGSWSRSRHEDWAASVARRREAVRRAEAEQTGGVVAEPIRMAEPAPVPVQPGRGEAESAAVPPVAEVESLLRRIASHERAGGSIPSLARTGEAPKRNRSDR
jgi:2Fe-2S ferredoxin